MPAKTLFETDTRKMHRPAYGVGATGASRSVLSTEGLSHAIGGVPTPAATGGGAIPRPRGYEPTRFPGITPPRPGLSSPVAINLPYNRQLPVPSPPQHSPADQPSYGDSYRPQIAPSQMPGPASRGIAPLPPSPFQGRQPAAPPAPAMPGVYPNQPHQIDVPPVPYAPPTVPGPQQPIPNVQHPYEGLGLTEQAFIGGQGNLPTPNRSAIPRINQYKQDYRQEHLGGLYDAVNEIANNNRYAAGVTPSPFNPLATPISGPGIYGQAVNAGGLMNNAEAQQFQRNVGYMPSRTVGGAFGGPGGQPLPFEKTPATGAQIDAYLGQNPNGRFFQGAQAGMVSTARGLRPGFTDGQPLPDLSQKPQFNAGAYETTPGGALTPSSATQLEAGRKAQELFDSRRGGTAQRQADYQDRVSANKNARSNNVQYKAINRAEARRERRGLFTPEEQLARANPGAYQARQAEESRTRAYADNAAADRGVRERLGLAEAESRKYTADKNLEGKYAESGVTPPGQKYEPQLPPLETKPDLPPKVSDQVREIAPKDPEAAREILVKNKITEESEQNKILQEATGDKSFGQPTMLGQAWNLAGDFASNLSHKAASSAENLLGLFQPKVVGASRKLGPNNRSVPMTKEEIEKSKSRAYSDALYRDSRLRLSR